MVCFLFLLTFFAKQGLGTFAENDVFRKQDKFAYKTEILSVRAYQFTESVQVCEVRGMRL